MILMWLGSIALMLFGFQRVQAAFREVTASFSLSLATRDFPKEALPSVVKSFLFALFQASPQSTQYAGISFLSLKKWNVRSSVLAICTSIFGVGVLLALGLLFANFNGALLMGVGSFFLLSRRLSPRLSSVLKLIFFTGLFLTGGEVALRSSSILQTLLGQSEFAFFLSDGRFSAVIPLLLMALVLSLFIDFEYWSFVLSLGLLLTNVISINGALAIVAGELLGRQVLFFIRTRSLDALSKRLSLGFVIASCAGIILGFLVAGEARSFFNLGFSLDFTASQAKIFDFVLMITLLHAVWCVVAMGWGHIAGNKEYEATTASVYPPMSWWNQGLFTEEALELQRTSIKQRLSEIRYHLKGLETVDKEQIPAPIQQRLIEEEQQLSALDQGLRK